MSGKSFSAREAAVISAAAVILAVLFTAMFFFSYSPVEVKEMGMHLKVANYTGFNLDTDALYFGAIAPGGSGERDLIISNEHTSDRSVKVYLLGELSAWVRPSESAFILSGGENKSVKFHVDIPEGAEYGEYEGTIRLVLTSAQ
jgi:uncharacterized membrane protein